MEPFIGQVTIFGGNFAPRGWAFCEGQLLAISQYDALFSILGTTYGGDGRTTFGLPDLRGRMAIQQGSGPGLPSYNLGAKGGANTTTLLTSNLPNTPIKIPASNSDADKDESVGNVAAVTDSFSYHTSADETLASGSIQGAQNRSHNNMQPSLGTNYVIALIGIYPSRN